MEDWRTPGSIMEHCLSATLCGITGANDKANVVQVGGRLGES